MHESRWLAQRIVRFFATRGCTPASSRLSRGGEHGGLLGKLSESLVQADPAMLPVSHRYGQDTPLAETVRFRFRILVRVVRRGYDPGPVASDPGQSRRSVAVRVPDAAPAVVVRRSRGHRWSVAWPQVSPTLQKIRRTTTRSPPVL